MRQALLLALALVGLAGPASAHLLSTDLGPFYDGALHPLVSPLDLLVVFGVALFAAPGGATASRRGALVLWTCWSAALLVAARVTVIPEAPAWIAGGLLIVLGLGAALRRSGGAPVRSVAAALLGVLVGSENGASAAATGASALSLLGIACGVGVVVLLVSGLVARLERAEATVPARVAGSWVAAAGLLLLGWELRGAIG